MKKGGGGWDGGDGGAICVLEGQKNPKGVGERTQKKGNGLTKETRNPLEKGFYHTARKKKSPNVTSDKIKRSIEAIDDDRKKKTGDTNLKNCPAPKERTSGRVYQEREIKGVPGSSVSSRGKKKQTFAKKKSGRLKKPERKNLRGPGPAGYLRQMRNPKTS